MSTAELKNYLHQLIVETNDTAILKKVQDYFKSLQKTNTTVTAIPESHKELVRERKKTAQANDFVKWDSVKNKFIGK